MLTEQPFKSLARLPAPGDNCAIAIRRIEAGTAIQQDRHSFKTSSPILEGHRFAIRTIQHGENLLSWGLPFGLALSDIPPGTYLCNEAMLAELKLHDLDFELPTEPNFKDLQLKAYQLDETSFRPAPPTERAADSRYFQGLLRPGSRGVGTRNYAVILGVTSQTAAFARLLAQRLQSAVFDLKNVDGIVPVAHTEGGGAGRPNNFDILLRTLAGFIVHPNVGAVLAIDSGRGAVRNDLLRAFMLDRGYPLHDVTHHFLTLTGRLEGDLSRGEGLLKEWLEPLDQTRRTKVSASHLKVALQCGGSDAFSGVSANPLAAWTAHEIIRHGGAANLAETDELIGAESYVLDKVRDLETARKFLGAVERYKQLAAWHGTNAEGNPSGGNRLRGLYNISLKSIGAAMKRHPETRLDRVVDYAEPMREPGFHFMDSPGNDLESVAGQVASGANLIFFTTGNGSITNFPFVPTLKIMTTTRRFRLLSNEMDVNAGELLDGTSLDVLGRRLFDLSLSTATGQPTQGEKAGHSQVSIWRDWSQTDFRRTERLSAATDPSGVPLPVKVKTTTPNLTFKAIQNRDAWATELVGLILPTSLCSGQIARMAAERLTRSGLGREKGVSRFATLVHTEGCGSAGRSADEFYFHTMTGYLNHPNVAHALLLEHGCEKMHNARLRNALQSKGLDADRFGYASVQLDGGVDRALEKIEAWFSAALQKNLLGPVGQVSLERMNVGLFSEGAVASPEAQILANLTRLLLSCGAAVVIPQSASILESPGFVKALLDDRPVKACLGYGQMVADRGLYVMDTPSRHAVETFSGLGATGVHLILAKVGERPLPAHPLVPILQFARAGPAVEDFICDLDLALREPSETWAEDLLKITIQTASREYTPKYFNRGYSDFQLSRGLLGVSM